MFAGVGESVRYQEGLWDTNKYFGTMCPNPFPCIIISTESSKFNEHYFMFPGESGRLQVQSSMVEKEEDYLSQVPRTAEEIVTLTDCKS